ncbi:unhealthy ribosome biogenesis protein 2 homolog [Tachyglossus aculeatus]|uniref:unhealthy ribosome biogenesis protein 2 homolog n=1 Tax=Tachyglossus aculeatus TaxID=9261 RepID=UPI0018F6B982|nr:unhealthy ribosome biogenesis protein 2 homolog [Tachyglossus aculeatus]XP_038617111.1 unhealthy ribosome biogenesis protein 2 homolog [Tachyglossus aculeatus]
MAAIYSGISLKLKSSKTAWTDKLKLAHFAWVSHQCFLPNKEQVLLDWARHTLVSYYKKKLELQEDIVERLWLYLDSILRSRKLQNIVKEGKTIQLHFSLAKVLNERIAEFQTGETRSEAGPVLSCCRSLLSVPALAAVYTAKHELLVELLSQLCRLACGPPAPAGPSPALLLDVLHLALGLYLLVQRQQANPNRVFAEVVGHLLQPGLVLRHVLGAGTGDAAGGGSCPAGRPPLAREIRGQIEAVLRWGLFPAELLPSYKEELGSPEPAGDRRKGVLKTLLAPADAVLAKLADAGPHEPAIRAAVAAHSVPLLFKLFLEAYCRDGYQLVCFQAGAKLLGCLRLAGLWDGPRPEPPEPPDWSSELLALEQVLTALLGHQVYNVAADRIRHRDLQFHFYRRLAGLLLGHPQPALPVWFRCLRALVSLNHLIVEPDLEGLVAAAWVAAEAREPRSRRAQEALLAALFQTYARLRQVPRLLAAVLAAVCRPGAGRSRPAALTAGLAAALSACFLELPPGQVLDSWALALDRGQALLAPSGQGDADAALKLWSVSSLLHTVLFAARTLDGTTPLPLVRRARGLVERMLSAIVQPALVLLLDHRGPSPPLWLEKVGNSGLLLAYTWAELDAMFSLNCDRYVSPAGAGETLPALLLGADAQGWDAVAEAPGGPASVGRHCLELLALQTMKRILAPGHLPTERGLQALRDAATLIVSSDLGGPEAAAAWDGQAGTVTALTYPAAHWHLVVSNLPLLLPYLAADDVARLAGELLRTGAGAPSPSDGPTGWEPDITVTGVSRALLRGPLLPEMQPLHAAFLDRVLESCASVLSAGRRPAGAPLRRMLPWLLARGPAPGARRESQPEGDEPGGPGPREEVAESLLALASAPEPPVVLGEGQLDALLATLDVVSALDLDGLPPPFLVRTYLLALTLVAGTRGTSPLPAARALRYLDTCFRLLSRLQGVEEAHAVFRVVFASEVFQVVVTALWASRGRFPAAAEAPAWTGLLRAAATLLERLLRTTVRLKLSPVLNCRKIVSFLSACGPYTEAVAGRCPRDPDGPARQVLLVAVMTLCRELSPLVHQRQGQTPARALPDLWLRVLSLAGAVVRAAWTDRPRDRPLPPVLLSAVAALLEAETSGETEDRARALAHADLYRDAFAHVRTELPALAGDAESLRPALRLLTLFCAEPALHPGEGSVFTAVFRAVTGILADGGARDQAIQNAGPQLGELLAGLLDGGTAADFQLVMEHALRGLDIRHLWTRNLNEVLGALALLKLLLSCRLTGEKATSFWLACPQIIGALAHQNREACRDPSLLTPVVLPVLEVLADLLRRGEGLVGNPHHVTLAFAVLLAVPLDHLPAEEYGPIFLGIHEVLFAILQCHPKVMMKAIPSFLNCFNRLLFSVMHEGRQKDKGNTEDQAGVLECARLVERMYSHIAAKAEEFTVFSPFMVAQYLSGLQKATLRPAVKELLKEGIYLILDICLERDIQFLRVSLPAGIRDAFKELHHDYTVYHKTKSEGEKKYTA